MTDRAPGSGGLGIAYERRRGSGPRTMWIHATGFCKEVWDPVLSELRAQGHDYDTVAMDLRSHGASGKASGPLDTWDLGRDALAVVEAIGYAPAVGIGHSSGGTSLVLAELLHPGTFQALILVEPIVYPDLPPDSASSFVSTALNRRRRFASPDEAFAAYRGKAPFAAWQEGAVRAYLSGGLEAVDGEWHLACPPEQEAGFYQAIIQLGAWDRLGEVDTPITIMVGAETDTYEEGFPHTLRAQFPNARLAEVPGAGHFIPMEQPAEFAALVAELVGAAAN